jgi:diguanylate cyclase (GGDEF)-like protein
MPKPTIFTRQFLAPQLVVLGSTLAGLFGLFWLMVTQQNDLAASREYAQLESAIRARVENTAINLRDYSHWDEAVEKLAEGDVDHVWANGNLGPYLHGLQGYDHSFVLDRHGHALYASKGTQRVDQEPSSLIGSDFAKILARLERAPEQGESSFAQLVSVNGQPAIVAGGVVLPSPGKVHPRPFARRYMVFIEEIDRPMLKEIADTYGFVGLRTTGAGEAVADGALPLLATDGSTVGSIAWNPSRPGDAARDRYAPWLAIIAGLAVLFSLFLLRRAHRASRDLAASEASAWHLANHDTLTGLPNRRGLREKGLRQAADNPMAVLFLDLDGFKEVNDLFGHQAGDELLKEAADRLRNVVGQSGLLVRVGGDEFAVLLTGPDCHDQALRLGPGIVEVMAVPFTSNQISLVVSSSVGIALGGPGQNVDDLCRLADIAMYAAKADGKNCWRRFSPEMDEGREVRMLLESELREAIERDEIEVMFQPIVTAREGEVVCVEVLARWTSPSQGPMGPAIFIPIAESSGQIVKIGEQVLRKACMAARDWNVDIAVNLSPAQFWHQTLAEDILAILRECDFPPHRLELEITEGYLLSRPELAADVMRRLRAQGIAVALDDFGTGFASIGYLRTFDLDRIKLDRSFVENIVSDKDAAVVAKAVINLSRALNLPITAEGVETQAQATLLALAGCERLQGWHYGCPVLASDMGVWLAGRAAEAAVRRA